MNYFLRKDHNTFLKDGPEYDIMHDLFLYRPSKGHVEIRGKFGGVWIEDKKEEIHEENSPKTSKRP